MLAIAEKNVIKSKGAVYCKSYVAVMGHLKSKIKSTTNGLKGLLQYGKSSQNDDQLEELKLISILSSITYSGILHVSRNYHKDWSLKPISLISLSEETDILEECLDHFFNFILVSILNFYVYIIYIGVLWGICCRN